MPWYIHKRYRHLQRYRKISEVLLRHGFGYLIQQLDLAHILPPIKRWRSLKPKESILTVATRIRLVIEELGPTFIKFGQLLSTRPDLLPPDILAELESLQDQVAPVPLQQITKTIEKELGQPVEQLFAQFDPEPIAAASIGQVHKATLEDGTTVVVKVRRPRISRTISTDLEILYGLARAVKDKLPKDFINPESLVDEFSRGIQKELDFSREGRSMERFRRNFHGDSTVVIPKVYWEYSTAEVLTMEHVQGTKVNRVTELQAAGHDLAKLGSAIAQAFVKQVFEDGFFHGDPHPGNILITPEGKVAFLDFGMAGRIDKPTMQALARLLVGITRRDLEEIVRVLEELEAFTKRPSRQLKADIAELIDLHYGKTLKELDFGQIVDDLLELVRQHPVQLPTEMLLLAKAFVTIEGVASTLAPDFNVMEITEPFAKQWVVKHYSPQAIARRGIQKTKDWADFFGKLPSELESLMHVINDGELRIHFQHEGLEKLMSRLDIVSNRLTVGIIIAALIIGSSLLLFVDQGPHLGRIPVIGFIGFSLAGLIGVWLMISILRSGRF